MDWRGLISFLLGLLESGNDQDFHFGIKLFDDKETDVECCQNIDDSSRSIKKKITSCRTASTVQPSSNF